MVLSGVYQQVLVKDGLLLEGLCPVSAHVGPGLYVDLVMLCPATTAHSWWASHSDFSMAQEIGMPPEGLSVFKAIKGPVSCVTCLLSGHWVIAAQPTQIHTRQMNS